MAIMPAIGAAEWLLKKLTKNEVTAPRVSCIVPSKADAMPPFLEKGAMLNAEVFGFVRPTQQKITTTWAESATIKSCSLLKYFSSNAFNWLEPIKPMEIPANTQPYCFLDNS